MKQRSRDGRRCHPELGEDRRHGQGVSDVGIAALALLPAVGLLCHDKGPLDHVQIAFGVSRAHGTKQGLQHWVVTGSGATEDRPASPHSRRRR